MILRKTKSFTLIELLVVIAIIGLLSSIVLVATRGSRAKAQIAKALEFSQTIHTSLGSEAVGVWDFDNCTASDASGYGNNGTINGAVCSSDTPYSAIGQGTGKNSLSFDGIDDYVECGNVNTGTNEISISTWINLSSTSVAQRPIINKGYTSHNAPYYQYTVFYTATDEIKFSLTIDGTLKTATTTSSMVSINTWYHILSTYDGADLKVYVNGNLEKTTNVGSGTLTTYATNMRIGEYTNLNQDYFPGKIDEVRIYNKSLSTAQIQQLYAEGLEKHKDLATK
jgi:prepilin-type N-terminal cleavage/methylation domain-containing protein